MEPNGSATMPPRPSLAKVADTESTVSAPNHVANTVATFMYSGRLRPATTKSFESCTRRAAHRPMAMVTRR